MASTADSWTELGFSNLQSLLDEQGTKIAAYQEEGNAGRKALSSQTKAFRKLNESEKLAELRGLLKAYQAGIDALTTRCQFAESCFMNVYRTLALVPDPSPLLQQQQQEIEKLKSAEGGESGPEESRLARDLERQTQRAAQLESQLKRQTAEAGSGAQAVTQQLEARIDELEAEVAASGSQLAKAQSENREMQVQAAQQQQDLRKYLAELAVKQDYDDLKREISELRAAEARDQSPAAAEPTSAGSEAANLRLTNQRLELDAQRLSAQNLQLVAEVEKSRKLVAKLEEDLSSLNQSDTFSTISGWTAVPRTGGPQRDSSVSAIITQQRDRYKARMLELEERAHTSEASLAQTKRDLELIRKDNHGLYERIRNMQASVPSTDPLPKRLYEPSPEMNMKDMGIDRAAMGMSRVNAAIFRVFGRAVADEKFRQGICVYAALMHVVLLWALGHSPSCPVVASPPSSTGSLPK